VARSAVVADSGADEVTCVDVGTVAVDVAASRACVRGTVIDEGGVGLADLDVTLFAGRRAFVANSGSDGSFCAVVSPEADIDVVVSGRVGGIPVAGAGSGRSVAGSGVCSEDACTDVGAVTAVARGCVTGVVRDGDGGVGGAVVFVNGSTTFSQARSAVDGSFCAPADRLDVVGVDAMAVDLVGGQRFGALRRTDVANSAGGCGDPADCTDGGVLVLEGEACVSGVAHDDVGAPLAFATVTSTPRFGGRERRVFTAADGSFWVPSVAASDVDITISKIAPGLRFFATREVQTEEAAAVCGGAGCTDLGVVDTVGQSVAACVVGRALDHGQPFSGSARVDVDGAPFAALRPREDGRYCIDLLQDTASIDVVELDEAPGGAQPRATVIDTAGLDLGSCGDEGSCTVVDDFDFADFCSGS
jgi:hypothetical protein